MHVRVIYAPLLVLAFLVAYSTQQSCVPLTGVGATVVYNATGLKANAVNRFRLGVNGYYAASQAIGPPAAAVRFASIYLNNQTDLLPDVAIDLILAPNTAQGGFSSSVQTALVSSLALCSASNTTPSFPLPIVGILSGISTAEAKIVQQVAQIYQVSQMSIHAFSSQLSNKADWPYFLRLIPSEVDQIASIVALMVRYNWTRGVILYSTNDYGATYTGLLLAGAQAGITFLGFPMNATANSVAENMPAMQKVADYMSDPKNLQRVLILWTTAANTAWIATTANQTTPRLYGPEYVWILTTQAAGALTQAVNPNPAIGIPTAAKPFLKGSIAVTVNSPNGSVWDSMLALYQAWTPIYNWVAYAPGNLYFYTIIDAVFAYAHAYQNLLNAGIPFGVITKQMLLSALTQVNFEGVTGTVQFDSNGDRRGIFLVYTFWGDNYTYTPFAKYSQITHSLETWDSPVFYDETENVPTDGFELICGNQICSPSVGENCTTCPVDCGQCERCNCPEGYLCTIINATDHVCDKIFKPHEYSQGLAGGLAAIVGVGFLVAMFALVMVLVYREIFFQKHGIFYCITVIVGVFCAYAGALVLLPERTDNLCLAFPWLIGVAFTFVYGCLFIKAWILYRIWRYAMQLKKMAITAFTVIKYVGVALAVEVAFLIIWSAVDPPKVRQHKMVDDTIQPVCKSDTDTFWIIFISMKGAWLMFGVIISVLTRNIMKEYSNFTQTVYAIYNMLVLIVIAIPLAVLLQDVADGVTIIALIIIVLAFMFTTIILFFETWFSVLAPDSNKIPAMNAMKPRPGNDTSTTGKAAGSASSRSSSSA